MKTAITQVTPNTAAHAAAVNQISTDCVTFIGARAFRAPGSGDQTGIGPSADVQVILDDEEYDAGNNYDTSTRAFTAPVAGYYQIHARIQWQGSEDGKLYRARIYKNPAGANVLLDESWEMASAAAGGVGCVIAATHYLAAGDIIALFGFHNQVANATIDGGDLSKTILEVALVGF